MFYELNSDFSLESHDEVPPLVVIPRRNPTAINAPSVAPCFIPLSLVMNHLAGVLSLLAAVSGAVEKDSIKLCCSDPALLSCASVSINPELILSRKNIKILGTELNFSSEVEPRGYVYHNSQGDEAVITLNQQTGNVFGTVNTHDNKIFSIEKCRHSHVIKQHDVSKFREEKVTESPREDPVTRVKRDQRWWNDNTTVVTYSVMIYYTQAFQDGIQSDLDCWLDNLFAVTNQGYINSKIPLRVTRFCTEKANIVNEKNKHMEGLLEEFSSMKGDPSGVYGSPTNLRNTADVAHLLVSEAAGGDCGIAYGGTYRSGNTVSVSSRCCARHFYTFGHEIAHHLGAFYNKEAAIYNHYSSYGRGFLIEKVS